MCPEPGEDGDHGKGKAEKKDRWDKAKIFGSISTAFILAFGAIMGSIFIPDKINRNSLESQKIIQLSELVPQLYDSTRALRPTTIAMASYGDPAVPFLLLALDDAIETKIALDDVIEAAAALDDTVETESAHYVAYESKIKDRIETIVSSMKYMDAKSKREVRARLRIEFDQLHERSLTPHNLKYINHLVSILEWPRLDKESTDLLVEYFSIVSAFSGAQYKLSDLNARILRTLAANGYEVSRLKLEGLNFEREDLTGIDFSNASLKGADLMGAKLYGCKFSGAILDSCILIEARFFMTHVDTLFILDTFRELGKSQWKKAVIDPAVADILTALEITPRNTDQLLQLATIAKESIY